MGGRADSDIFVVQPIAGIVEGAFSAFCEVRDFVLLEAAFFKFFSGEKVKI